MSCCRNWLLPALAMVTLCGCGSRAHPDIKYRIAVVPKGLTHEFWQSVHRGAERAAADLKDQGVATKILWEGPRKEDDAQAQLEIIDLNLTNHINGLVLAPQHSETMVAKVETAVEKNVPVVIIDSGLSRQDLIVKYVATDNYHGGELAAEHLLKVLREAGKPAPKLVLFRYQRGSESTDRREQGFVDVVNRAIEEQRKAGQPTITWLSDDQFAGATKDSAIQKAMPLLNSLRGKDIDGLFAPNESSASGMLEALRSQGLTKKVKFVGFDSSEPLLQALDQGDIDGLVVQDPYRMGYLGVWTLVQHLEGKNVCPDGKKELSTGEHLITKANLNATSTRELFDPALQAQRKIETPPVGDKR